MTRYKDIPKVWTAPSGDGHHRYLRDMTPTELAEREARQHAYDAMLARQQHYENSIKRHTEEVTPRRKGCVFVKSCELPEGIINYESPTGFIPIDSVHNYGTYALLGGREVDELGRVPLKKISGTVPTNIGALTLAGTSLRTAGPIISAAGLASAGVIAASLVGIVALIAPAPLGDSALYTEDQLRSLTEARTRVRLRVEQQADGTLKGYGFNTQSRRDWEMVPVITFTTQDSNHVAEFGGGVTLIWTPAIDPKESTGIPPLEAAPQGPHIWIFPPTPAADGIIVDPVYPPEYKDFILVFPADSGIQPLYIVVGLEFDAASYHGKRDTPIKSKGPTNGQETLETSVQVKPTSPRRVGIDPGTGEFVVFDRTGGDIYHGHVRPWDKLHQDMKNALIKADRVDNRGNILGAKR